MSADIEVPLLDLSAQNQPLKKEIFKAIEEVFDSNRFILGKKVEDFEKEIAEYLGVKHAIGVSSGTDALLLSLMALGIRQGDAVVTTTFSFFATAGVIVRAGAKPFFADIEPDTYNICSNSAELAVLKAKKEGYNVKAVIPVHLYGQCADMKAIMELAQKYNLKVIEDAAQAIGAKYQLNSKMMNAGTIGDCGCFSFFPSKNLGCLGDGGLVVTNNDSLADKMKLLRVHGARPKYYHSEVGGNFRLDALQAALLSKKLPQLNEWHNRRRKNAAVYRGLFAKTDLISNSYVQLPIEKYPEIEFGHIYNQFVIRVKERENLKAQLTEHKIGTEIYYPVPFHLQKCFSALCYSKRDFPAAERAADEVLAIPIYAEITKEQQKYVVDTIENYYRKAEK